MLRPIPAALASCTRFFEAMTAMKDSFETLQQMRVGHMALPPSTRAAADFVTPPPRRETALVSPGNSVAGSWKTPENKNPIEGESQTSALSSS